MVEEAILDAKINKSTIDDVAVVGGIPKIQTLINVFKGNIRVNISINSVETIARGAALRSDILRMTPYSLGIEEVAVDGTMAILIKRNTRFPIKTTNNQTMIPVYEGERALTKGHH